MTTEQIKEKMKCDKRINETALKIREILDALDAELDGEFDGTPSVEVLEIVNA